MFEIVGALVAFIGFKDGDIKSRAERFQRSITNSIEIVMKHNVEVRMGLMVQREASINRAESPASSSQREMAASDTERELRRDSNNSPSGRSESERNYEQVRAPKERYYSEGKFSGSPQPLNFS